MKINIQKLKLQVLKYLDLVPNLILIVIIMVFAYGFMLVGCALDDACYNVHMKPIMEVPYVPQQR